MAVEGLNDATLAALLAEAEAAQTRVRLYLERCAALPVSIVDDWPAEPGHPDLISIAVAARRQGVSRATMYRTCERDGVGRRYGQRLRVSLSRLAKKNAR